MTHSSSLPFDYDLTRLESQLPPGWKLDYFPEIESTNDWALRRFREQPPTCPTFVLARTQTRGRGRSDRTWQAAAGSLTCSLAFPLFFPRCTQDPLRGEARLTWPTRMAIATALGTWETAHDFLVESRCQIKWPNDILIDQRKAAGILIESCFGTAAGSDQPRTQTAVIGIGLNVNVVPQPKDLDRLVKPGLPPTGLAAATGNHFDLTEVAATLLRHLAVRLNQAGFICNPGADLPLNSCDKTMIDEFNQRLAWRQQAVVVRQGTEEVSGLLEGLDEAGLLELSTQLGRRKFAAGELRSI